MWRLVIVLSLLNLEACKQRVIVEPYPEEFTGVGLELRLTNGRPVVVHPLTGGPAAQAGIERNDILMKIDDNSTENLCLGEVVMRLRGLPGSQVKITALRGEETLDTVITRTKMSRTKGLYHKAKLLKNIH